MKKATKKECKKKKTIKIEKWQKIRDCKWKSEAFFFLQTREKSVECGTCLMKRGPLSRLFSSPFFLLSPMFAILLPHTLSRARFTQGSANVARHSADTFRVPSASFSWPFSSCYFARVDKMCICFGREWRWALRLFSLYFFLPDHLRPCAWGGGGSRDWTAETLASFSRARGSDGIRKRREKKGQPIKFVKKEQKMKKKKENKKIGNWKNMGKKTKNRKSKKKTSKRFGGPEQGPMWSWQLTDQ